MELTKSQLKEMIKQELMNEGPAYEYAKNIKNIEKKKEVFGMEVLDFIKLLKKKGLGKEGVKLAKLYRRHVTEFGLELKKLVRKLI